MKIDANNATVSNLGGLSYPLFPSVAFLSAFFHLFPVGSPDRSQVRQGTGQGPPPSVMMGRYTIYSARLHGRNSKE